MKKVMNFIQHPPVLQNNEVQQNLDIHMLISNRSLKKQQSKFAEMYHKMPETFFQTWLTNFAICQYYSDKIWL